jgi:hypothetical protein
VLIRCPSCKTRVWVTDNAQCPSCRKSIPQSLLASAAQAQPPAPASGDAPRASASAQPGPAAQPAVSLLTTTAIPRNSSKGSGTARRATARRTSWAMIAFGVFFMAMGVWSLKMSGEDNSHSSARMSRRGRALENLLGETGTEVLMGIVFVGIGGLMISQCRREMVLGAPPSGAAASPGGCDLCGRQSPDAAEAFLSINGGFKPFPGAFSLRCCEACRAESRRILHRFRLMMVFIFPAIPLVLISAIVLPIDLFSKTELKPGAPRVLAILIGMTIAVVALLFYLRRAVGRRTARLLGPEHDATLRAIARVRRWGWPRRIAIRREIEAGMPVIPLV